jgi:hypothetical protein
MTKRFVKAPDGTKLTVRGGPSNARWAIITQACPDEARRRLIACEHATEAAYAEFVALAAQGSLSAKSRLDGAESFEEWRAARVQASKDFLLRRHGDDDFDQWHLQGTFQYLFDANLRQTTLRGHATNRDVIVLPIEKEAA